MKYDKIYSNETIIIDNGFPYVLERVTDIEQGETADVCHYCDLQTMCKHGDGYSQLIELCMPNDVGHDCCFHIDYDYRHYKINDFIL